MTDFATGYDRVFAKPKPRHRRIMERKASPVPNSEIIELLANPAPEIKASFRVPTGIAALCDDKSTRAVFGCVQVTPRNTGVTLAATNGYAAAVVKADGTANGEHLCPSSISRNGSQVRLNGRWENTAGHFAEPTLPEAKFPRVRDVVPDISETGYLAIPVDVGLLLKLVSALNADRSGKTLVLHVRTGGESRIAGDAIAVTGNAGIGAMMPAHLPRPTHESDARSLSGFQQQHAEIMREYRARK